MIASPPRWIGVDAVASMLNVHPNTVYRMMGRGMLQSGYVGKIAGRHTWNLHEFAVGLYPSQRDAEAALRAQITQPKIETVCGVAGCGSPTVVANLCRAHYGRLMLAFAAAEDRVDAGAALVSMCRWVVVTNPELIVGGLPTRPLSDYCQWPGCTEVAVGFLCRAHTHQAHKRRRIYRARQAREAVG